MSSKQRKIVVCATLAATPNQGGWVWAVLQYVLGFRKLGYDVHFLESISQEDLSPNRANLHQSRNGAFFQHLFRQFGLDRNATLWLTGSRETVGLDFAGVVAALNSADVLVNISGAWKEHDLATKIPIRVYVDVDPTYTQLWQHVEGIDMNLSWHTHFLTVGPAIGQPSCEIPSCGVEWLPTYPPVFLDCWPVTTDMANHGITTVANWRGYGSVSYEGIIYGQKAHSFRELIELPRRTSEELVVALGIDAGEERDLQLLAENRWQRLDPFEVAGTAAQYQRFVQGSKAELGIAKSGYVKSKCGWFSDRSVCYLASGRPVIAQDTGFGRYLPTGEGLFAFETGDEVVNTIDAMNRDYSRHAAAARHIAETYFCSDRVLSRLLQEIGALS